MLPVDPEGTRSVFMKENLELMFVRPFCRKYKIPNCQNGHAYLTSHRACYVDNEEPRKNSVAVALKDVDRYEFYARLSLYIGRSLLL
jgi:hypothetical protein